MKRLTLIQNLQRAVDNLPNQHLPANIETIYAIGSILREKKKPGDMDLIIFYTQTKQQTDEWNLFVKNFNREDFFGKISPIHKIEELLVPFREIELDEAVKTSKLASILNEHGIDSFWAGCFSWSEVLGYQDDFTPRIDQVLKRIIFGRRAKGFHHIDFKIGKSPAECFHPLEPYQQNNCLVWSREKPDVQSNIMERTPTEKFTHNSSVLDHFLIDDFPLVESEFSEAKKRALEVITKLNIKANVNALVREHVKIIRTGNEDSKEIAKKVEQARAELKKYQAEITVLRIISDFSEYLGEYSNEERLAETVIRDSRPRGLSDAEARRILQIIGLPEANIITVKKYGVGTYYELVKNNEERLKIVAEAQTKEQRNKTLTQLVTLVHSIDRRAKVRLDYNEDNRLKELIVYFEFPIYKLNEEQVSALEQEMGSKGFEVRKIGCVFMACKWRTLIGTEDNGELKKIARELLDFKPE